MPVCVAGAGGYIGSALVKALAFEGSRSLILLDSSEYGLFKIQRHMETEHSAVSCQYILGSVGDAGLLEEVFTHLRPEIIFHAAAFKHVGLLERNLFAAIGNNVFGTYTLCKSALRHSVSKLVLVSTDKAVRPHSIMGVSKRVAELVTLSLGGNAVRLGNVICSTGSVIPLFLEQIEKGEPLSVTHPEASRYFLSIDETVAAILAAGSAPCKGKILLPKFADPVRIVDLARSLGGALPIRFTGLGPGEKMTEDLIGPDEAPIGTIDGPLTVLDTRRFSPEECDEAVASLSACIARRDVTGLIEALCRLVPEYTPSVRYL
jgi:FlaA1/EpsC-like NDP-sugar epimerase